MRGLACFLAGDGLSAKAVWADWRERRPEDPRVEAYLAMLARNDTSAQVPAGNARSPADDPPATRSSGGGGAGGAGGGEARAGPPLLGPAPACAARRVPPPPPPPPVHRRPRAPLCPPGPPPR